MVTIWFRFLYFGIFHFYLHKFSYLQHLVAFCRLWRRSSNTYSSSLFHFPFLSRSRFRDLMYQKSLVAHNSTSGEHNSTAAHEPSTSVPWRFLFLLETFPDQGWLRSKQSILCSVVTCLLMKQRRVKLLAMINSRRVL